MKKKDREKYSHVFKVLSHPIRLHMVNILLDDGFFVNDIKDTMGISQPVTSHHLSILKSNGIVYSQTIGAKRLYRVSNDCIKKITSILLSLVKYLKNFRWFWKD